MSVSPKIHPSKAMFNMTVLEGGIFGRLIRSWGGALINEIGALIKAAEESSLPSSPLPLFHCVRLQLAPAMNQEVSSHQMLP